MVEPKPLHTAVGNAEAVMVGDGFTTTVTDVVFVQPLPSVPVTL